VPSSEEIAQERIRQVAAEHSLALDLSGLRLVELPEEVRSLTWLEQLHLNRMGLTLLPDWLSDLHELDHLELDHNRIRGSLAVVAELRWLELLSLNGLGLHELPSWLSTLGRLEILSASDNLITELPDWLSDLPELAMLYVSGNKLASLPTSLARVAGLRYLAFNENSVSRIPDWIGRLTGLWKIYAEGNRLTELPDEMSKLVNLNQLDLRNNELSVLPDWLLNLPKVELDVRGNPLVSPPPEIAENGRQSIMEFFRARRAGSTRQWISKMLVVGEGGVGKTSTIKALLGERFNRTEEMTHGLRIRPYIPYHPDRPSKPMLLKTWDFGGQQIYHATHQFFLSDRSLFLLLWNSRLGWEQGRLRYWLDIITARAPESPVLLVATNTPAGGRPADLPLDDLRSDYPQIRGNISIDNGTRDGLTELADRIGEVASGLPLMGSDWPTAWLSAADAMRACPEKHVSPGRMWQIMADAGLTNEEHQRYMASALHHLGEILYYKDVPSLADTVILQPEWVNEYISKVLDSPEVEQRHGLLSREHVNSLWSDLDRGMRDHFLDMMDRYDLSYRLDGGTGNDVSLVVERLSWKALPYEEAWGNAEPDGAGHEIRVIYQLNTTPPGIPTWFIARSHRFTTGKHWRTGALLAHPDGSHRALVKTNPHRNELELTVRGPAPASFFGVLDDGLTLTLDRYPGLSIRRLVPCPCGGPEDESNGICDGVYDYDDLVRRLNRKPPRHEIECLKSGRDVSVPLMLLGLAPTRDDELRGSIVRLERTLTEQHHELASRLADVSGDMQRAFLKVQQQVQLGLETRCPSVFTVVPIKLSTVKNSLHELRLYCEEPGMWHPLTEGEGCYQIRESPEWIRRYGPYLHKLVTVLKYLAPLANPVLGMAVGVLSTRTKSEVDMMKVLVDQLPMSVYGGHPLLGDEYAPIERASTEGDFRALEAMLTELDPDRRWGGLSRIDTPEGLALYLCRDHAAPYLRTARAPVTSP